jgi:hypothetical protein
VPGQSGSTGTPSSVNQVFVIPTDTFEVVVGTGSAPGQIVVSWIAQ